MAVRDQGKATSDLVNRQECSDYVFLGKKLANQQASEQKLNNMVGYPVKDVSGNWEVVLALDEANTEGLLIEARSVVLDATTGITPDKVTAIVNGPATINVEGIATVDPAGTDYTVATIVTALAALSPPIKTKDNTGSLVVKPLHDGAFPE